VDENGKPTAWEAADLPSGPGTMTVTIDEQGTASHTAADIRAHVQRFGIGSVTLLYNDSYYAPVKVDEGVIWFCYNSDDGYAYSIAINEDFPIEEYEHSIPNDISINAMIDRKLAQIPIAEEARF
jgi:hypothetical protein